MKKKTLQLLGGNSWGGGCALIKEHVAYLVNQGWEVHLLSSHPEVIQKMSEVEGVRIISDINIPRDIEPKQDLKALREVLKLCKLEQYDVFHSYNTMPGLVGRTAAKLAKVPLIFHHQAGWNIGPFNSKVKNFIFYFGEMWGMLMSTKAICCSHTIRKQADEYRLNPKSRLVVVCNGIDSKPFENALESGSGHAFRSKHGISPDTCVVGCHGRLNDLKNNVTLIKAAAIIKRDAPNLNFKFVLAGDGEGRGLLEQQISDHGVGDCVQLLGYTTEIPQFLAATDIFAMASLREGMSISLMEAMAAKRPIVCSNIPQNTELICDDTTGFAVDTLSAESFAEKILRIATEPGLSEQLGAAAHARLVEKYSLTQFLERTFALYVNPKVTDAN